MRRCIYPGSFDPFHNGHRDVVHRAALMFDEVIILVSENHEKKHLFTTEERVWLIRKEFYSYPEKQKVVRVASYAGLVTDFAKENDALYIVRGVRGPSDLEVEARLDKVYRSQDPRIQTILMMPRSDDAGFISSSVIKEVAKLGGNYKSWVSTHIAETIERKLK